MSCRYFGTPEDAEDVLQDTLLTAARSIRSFRGTSSLSTWLYSIARSFCIKKRRKSKFAPAEERSLERELAGGAEELSHPGQGPDDLAFNRETQHILDQALRALEPEQREVILLRDVEGLKASEAAEVLGISVAAVKSRLHRARRDLRDGVAARLGRTGEAAPAATCPDVLSLYSQHLEGDISAELCAQMERHLDSCERCHALCDSLKHTLALCSRLEAPVPAHVQNSVRSALQQVLNRDAPDADA